MPVLQFGPFRLDPEQLLLFRGEEPVPLTPKALQLLLALVEARGELVSKEELTRRLWPDVVTTPGNLHQCVKMVRRALGTRPDGRDYVETSAKAGYRLAAPVFERSGPVVDSASPANASADPSRRRLGIRFFVVAAAGAAAAAFIVGGLARRASIPRVECKTSAPTAVSGYRVSSFATGFPYGFAGDCQGVVGMAFAPNGDLYAVDESDGNLYRFGPHGGVAGPATRVTRSPYPTSWCLSGLAFSKDGRHLFLARQLCALGGDVVEISPADGSLLRTVATGITCATGLATDPLSGDLFVATPCPGGTDNIYRIESPTSSAPRASIYATPGAALGLALGPDGSLWSQPYRFDAALRSIVRMAGTGAAAPGAYEYVTSDPLLQDANAVVPAVDPASPLTSSHLFVLRGSGIALVDLTVRPPKVTPLTTRVTAGFLMVPAPDGCLVADDADRIIRLSAADGSCQLPSLGGDRRFLSAFSPDFAVKD